MPAVTGLLESALYVEDVGRSVEFYRRILGFDAMFVTDRAAGLGVAGAQVLLLFRKGGTRESIVTERGVIPPHDGDGCLHLAFAVPAESLDEWERHLALHEVDVEARYDWERGGRSVYFRDPDDHLVELVTPGCWPIY